MTAQLHVIIAPTLIMAERAKQRLRIDESQDDVSVIVAGADDKDSVGRVVGFMARRVILFVVTSNIPNELVEDYQELLRVAKMNLNTNPFFIQVPILA